MSHYLTKQKTSQTDMIRLAGFSISPASSNTLFFDKNRGVTGTFPVHFRSTPAAA